jgi:malonyl-CoA decarboxylase
VGVDREEEEEADMNEQPRRFLQRVWETVRQPPTVAAVRAADDLVALCDSLLSERGEVSGARIAADAMTAYEQLTEAGRDAFFARLVDHYGADASKVNLAMDNYRANPTPSRLHDLHVAAESRRQELFRRLNTAPGGTRTLVQLRADLLRTLDDHPERSIVDVDLVHMFRSWFNRGFLVLQRIDWRTSALVLERLIQYEAVHQIQGWDDLRRRLEKDRRCYAFFHPALPDEPLIFIEAALTQGIVGNVQPLLDPRAPIADPADARCAIFYSITNCQLGLRGVSFGNFLVKQVVEDLSGEFRRLRKFATLSPVPGFRAWLSSHRAFMSEELALLEAQDGTVLAKVAPALKDEILRLCAYFLLRAKRGHAPLDPVARFHLANGARLSRLNWLGDSSRAGVAASLGVTANYVYRIADVEANHEAYAKDFRVVTSSALERLAREVKVPA